jgi:hypothetical protein
MRFTPAALLLLFALPCTACISPPDKEINQARGAIAAAHAAGGDAYAPDEYQAALTSLKHAEDAVGQRDYRQALNYALESREQAQNAARTAADQKAAVSSQAERDLHDLQAVLDEANAKLKAAETQRPKRRVSVQPEQRTIASAEASVQKARAALNQQDYIGARDALRGVADGVREAMRRFDERTAAEARSRRH